jgi:hypothetical protein
LVGAPREEHIVADTLRHSHLVSQHQVRKLMRSVRPLAAGAHDWVEDDDGAAGQQKGACRERIRLDVIEFAQPRWRDEMIRLLNPGPESGGIALDVKLQARAEAKILPRSIGKTFSLRLEPAH